MRIDQSTRDGYAILAPAGEFDLAAMPTLRRVLLMPQFLAVHPTLADALAQARSRPPCLRAELALGPSPTAPAAARRFLHAICWQWRLEAVGEPDDLLARRWVDELVDRAMLVASELVTNAVVHTQGPLRLRLELLAGRLRLAVADQSPRLLGLAADRRDPEAEGGRGLQVVDQLASSWGVQHPLEGGKVIWCMLDAES